MNRAKFIILSLSLFFALLSGACAQSDSTNQISAAEFLNKMNTDTNLVVLDVRNAEELSGPLGKIDTAVNIPVQELEKRVDELDKFKDKTIAVICRTGRRSARGTEILLKNGFKAVNVAGGMTEFSVLNKPKE